MSLLSQEESRLDALEKRQKKLRAKVWGTDNHPTSPEPLDYTDETLNEGKWTEIRPEQPSVEERFRNLEISVQENKERSEKNQKKIDNSLENKARRFFRRKKLRI